VVLVGVMVAVGEGAHTWTRRDHAGLWGST
jgi:hypothetical protein